MKNKLLIGLLCMGTMAAAAGCSSYKEVETQPAADMETAAVLEITQKEDGGGRDFYEELIAAVRECIRTADVQMPEKYGFSSAMITSGSDGTLGYLIEDIDGNGIDELIFGENRSEPDGSETGIIYDIYTISDGELVHVVDGWERNRYYLCETGMIANEGSSGAVNSNYAYFTFDGTALQLVEAVLYDGVKDSDHPWFYSTGSEYDAKNAEPISEERAKEIMEGYVYTQPTFIPFAGNP